MNSGGSQGPGGSGPMAVQRVRAAQAKLVTPQDYGPPPPPVKRQALVAPTTLQPITSRLARQR